MSARLDQLQPWLQPYARYLVQIASSYGAHVTSTRRTHQEQAQLFATCGSGQCRYPAAPPGHSKHEIGRAWDMVAHPYVLRQLGALWERIGGTWGGRFGDEIHFEA